TCGNRVIGGIHSTLFYSGLIPAANDFLLSCFSTHGVVADTVPRHINPHIGGGLVGRIAIELFQHGFEQGECFNISIIAHCLRLKGGEMISVNIVVVNEMRSHGLIRMSDGVLKRQSTDGERFEFSVPRENIELIVVIDL